MIHKKTVAFLLALTAFTAPFTGTDLTLTASHAAEDYTISSSGLLKYGDFQFNVINENELYLCKYSGALSDVEVPEQIGTYTVTGLESGAFNKNSNINNVVLPDSISYISRNAFSGSSVVKINIPENTTIIPRNAFSECSSLETVIFHDNITAIDVSAFSGTDIAIPENLQSKIIDSSERKFNGDWIYTTSIAYNAERGNYLSNTLTGYTGKSLDITIPEQFDGIPVNDMGAYFNMSTKVESVTFPETINFASLNVFNYPEMKKIVFLNDEVIFSGNLSNSGIEEINLPVDSVEYINLPETIRKIEFTGTGEMNFPDECFSGYTSLETIGLSGNYTSVIFGRNSFENSGITALELNQPCVISSSAFSGCENLKTIVLKSGAEIENYAFSGCTELVSVEIDGYASLERNAFLECTSLENISLDISEPFAGEVFNGCSSLMNINSESVFNAETGDFNPEYKEFVLSDFNGADDVGFINEYVKSEVKRIVSENVPDNASDIEKVKILHDWVCNNTKYASDDINQDKYITDASILMNDSTICQGYAKMCNLLFNEAGIETYYINSFDHAWNIVRIGGHYFHIDSTWDDGDVISYDNFMKSDAEFNADGGSHTDWSARIPSSLHSFQKSGTPECLYSVGDVNTDGKISVADLVKSNRYIMGAESITAENAVLYDLNFDGDIDVFDTINMRKLVISAE